MKCPSCNKFAGFNTDAEPEVNVDVSSSSLATKPIPEGSPEGTEPEFDTDTVVVQVDGDCRIVLTSECCGDEMKESSFTIEGVEIEVNRAEGCVCDLTEVSAEVESSQVTDRNQTHSERVAKRGSNKGQVVKTPIPYRYQKRFYGAEVEIKVACECGKSSASETWSDEVQASGMDEMV